MKGLAIVCTADRSERALFEGLAGKGISLSVIADSEDRNIQQLINSGIAVHTAGIRHRFDRQFTSYVKELYQQEKFDFIYAPTSKGLSTVLLGLSSESVGICSYRGTLGNLSYFDPASLRAHLHPRVDAIVCVCDAVRRFLFSMGLPDERLATVYKGHDPLWYNQGEKKSREQENLRSDSFVVGCIANIRPLKGIDVLLHAVAGMEQRERIEVLLVGEMRDPSIPPLIEKLGLTDRVQCTGYRKDVSGLIGLCDVTVMPSVRREGLARAVIESLSLGVPTIVSDTGGLPETVEDRVSGRVVPAGDAEALSKCLDEFTALPSESLQQMGKQSYRRVVEKFNLEKYVEEMYRVFSAAALSPGKNNRGYLHQIGSRLRQLQSFNS